MDIIFLYITAYYDNCYQSWSQRNTNIVYENWTATDSLRYGPTGIRGHLGFHRFNMKWLGKAVILLIRPKPPEVPKTSDKCIMSDFIFTFILRSWDCASLMYLSITNKMQRYTMIFITINALHVSGGSSAHHQELKTVYTASIFVELLQLLTACVSQR
jgi:hypothetical protein